jgi:hypothetical protein
MGPARSAVVVRVRPVMLHNVSKALQRAARVAQGRAASSPVMLLHVAVFVAKK